MINITDKTSYPHNKSLILEEKLMHKKCFFTLMVIALSLFSASGAAPSKMEYIENQYSTILDVNMSFEERRTAILRFVETIDRCITSIQSSDEFVALSESLKKCGFWIAVSQKTDVDGATISVNTLHFTPPMSSFGQMEQNWNWYLIFDSNRGVIDSKSAYPQSDIFLQNAKIEQLDTSKMVVLFTGYSTYNHPFIPFSVELEIQRIL